MAMVGDGVNDSVALTEADVGIAIGRGVDVAIDSADVVLTRDSLCDAVGAIKLGRRTLINIYENLFWAFCYNIIGIPLAAGVFIPLFGVSLTPMFGAMAMSISSFIVVMNALRLNLYNPLSFTINKELNKNDANDISKEKEINVYKNKENDMNNLVIKIEGMMCPHCSGRVKKSLEEHPSVLSADVSHERKDAIITLNGDVDKTELEKIITDAGYSVIE